MSVHAQVEIETTTETTPTPRSVSSSDGNFKDTHGIKNKHIDIYNKYAFEYDEFIAKQDYQHNLVPTIDSIFPVGGCDNKVVIELGGGTGRLAHKLIGYFKQYIILDNSLSMLEQAKRNIDKNQHLTCTTICSDYRQIPARDGIVDLIIAPWSLSYLKVNYEQTWKEELNKVFIEVQRVGRPDSTLLIMETLGTGYNEPRRSGSWYYKYLTELGFQFKWTRTDYYFQTTEEAVEQMRFFFGRVVANRVANERMSIVPECTGFWWIRTNDLTIKR